MLLISHILFFSSLVILMREDYLSRMVSVKYIIAFMAAAIFIGLSSSVFSLWISNTVVNLSVLFFFASYYSGLLSFEIQTKQLVY